MKRFLPTMVIVAAAGAALAHGSAEWIMVEPSYKRADGVHCCGPSDCERAPDDAVLSDGPGRWFIPSTGQHFSQDDKGVYPSVKAGFWWCRKEGRVVCLFFEGGAS